MVAVAQDTPLLLQIALTVCCRNRLLERKCYYNTEGFSFVHNRWLDDGDNIVKLYRILLVTRIKEWRLKVETEMSEQCSNVYH
jgi:hypothetical protein